MLPDARGYRIDNGAENYRRFLRGDEEGIAEIVRAYKDGLIFYLNGYVNDISLWEDYKIDFFAFLGVVFVPLRKILSFQG